LTTTDPAAHVAGTVDGVLPTLEMSCIDPAEEVERYIARAMATKGAGLDEAARALLLEDLQSPCTEEVAVFHAFSRTISRARSVFVVLDTAPTGHSLMLLDATGAYHVEVIRSLAQEQGLAGVTTPLMRLRDPAHSRVLIATLPEATPVEEAAELQQDLRRAGIEPYAWIVNGSLAATATTDPLLVARAAQERIAFERVAELAGERAYLVPWQPEEPVGVERLRQLAGTVPVVA
jgi:arsenite-transporting ATPase